MLLYYLRNPPVTGTKVEYPSALGDKIEDLLGKG